MRLIVSLIVMAWGDGSSALTDRFEAARGQWADAGRGATYQGWVKAIRGHGLGLLRPVCASLRRRMLSLGSHRLRRYGFFVLAVDGSRFELPRTAKHEREFGMVGKDERSPQLWVTMLWQLGASLPWDWRVGRSNASERHDLLKMLGDTPHDTLIVADAGFTGYEHLRRIIASGRHFLLRVGRGVELLEDLGYAERMDDQTVYLWPGYAQRADQPPLVLRLIAVREGSDRRRKMYLLTSVRSASRLSDDQAGRLYRMRWGVELGYRSLKQTLERRKLRSAAPANALFEMHGLMLGLMVLGLISVGAVARVAGRKAVWSVASALRCVRRGIRKPLTPINWRQRLGHAVRDTYERRRKTRQPWPRKKSHDPPPGKPKVRPARHHEVNQAMWMSWN